MTCNDCIHGSVCAYRINGKILETTPKGNGVETVCEHFSTEIYHVCDVGNIGLKTPIYTPPPMPKIKARQQTNGDRLRAMSDEELAGIMIGVDELDERIHFCQNLPECEQWFEDGKDIPEHKCKDCLMEWLQQPAKEET